MRLRQEQVVFLGTVVVLGLIAFSLGSEAKKRRGQRRSSETAELVSFEAPDVTRVLPDGSTLSGDRELFVPPSDTRRLPPLDLVEPPREELAALLPPTVPGPRPRSYGALLRSTLAPVERPDLFDLERERPPEPPAGTADPSDAGLETPAQELQRQVGYRARHDWIQRRTGTTIYGRIVNEDRFGLVTDRTRVLEPLRFVQVDPDTGREVYASVGAPAIAIERDRVQDFGFAATPSNEIELDRLRMGETIDAANFETALSLADRCIRLRLEAPQALATAKELFRACSQHDPGAIEPRRGLARAHAAGFEFDEALQLFTEAARSHPEDVETQIGLAAVEEVFLLERDAEERLRRATELRAGWRASWALGRFLLARGRADEAREHLVRAVLEVPQDPGALELRVGVRADLGSAHLALGDAEEAARVFARALAADAGNEQALAGLRAARLLGAAASAPPDALVVGAGFELQLVAGVEALVDGRYEASLELLRGAAQADPLHAHRALGALSFLAEVTGHPDEALRHAQEALEHTPDDAWCLFQLGRLLADSDDYEGAQSAFLAALAVEPDFEDALAALGEAAFQLGRFEDAERYLERAAFLDAGRAEVHALRGLNALRRGSSALARTSFEDALALDAAQPTAHAGMAWCEYRDGDPTEARVLFANIDRDRRELGEDDPYRTWARQQIERIVDHEEKVEWVDGFERRELRNGWTVREGVGPLVSLRDGAVHVEGVFAEDGRTSIFREYPASRFVSFEIDIRIDPATTVRTGIFVARERQRQDRSDTVGEVSLSRHKDGTLELAFKRQGQPAETIEVPEPFPVGRRVRLRVEREGEAADALVTLSLDGIVLIEDAPFPALGRASTPLLTGVFLEGEPGRRALLELDDAAVVYRE